MNKKSILSILLCALFTLQGFAQSSQMVFIEEATQASCPPCADQNPGFDALLDANSDKVVVLKYQTSWPGFDQMNLDNPDEVQDRVDYYGIQGVPSGRMNGTAIANDCGYYAGAPACLSQNEINTAYNSEAAFDMDISATFDDGLLNISGTITANEGVSGDLRLRVALTEKTIEYDDVPGGGNGETEYHHVLKKFILGGTDGIELYSSWLPGDNYTIDESLPLGEITIYSYPEIEIVAFVQDDNTQKVYQAAKDADIPLTISFANNATAAGLSNLPTLSACTDELTVEPIFTLQNSGNETLTSADIMYSLNGNPVDTYAWTGSLATLETAQITFPEQTLTISTMDTFSVSVQNPNGVMDENISDNVYDLGFSFARIGSNTLNLELTLDFFGTHTSWELRNSAGDVLYNGGPYENGSFETIMAEMSLPEDGCYDFEIFDSAGNGICCSLGEGSYTLSDGSGAVLAQGSQYGAGESTPITFDSSLSTSVEETIFEEGFTLSPNPTSGNLMLNFGLEAVANTTVSIHDMMGAQVMTIDLGTLASGPHIHHVKMNNLANGIYIVRLSADDDGFVSKKVVLAR